GGRIIGEACHFIDLARFLVGEPIEDVHSTSMGQPGAGLPADTASIALRFADGSIATAQYFATGSKKYPKERVEVITGGRLRVARRAHDAPAHAGQGSRRRDGRLPRRGPVGLAVTHPARRAVGGHRGHPQSRSPLTRSSLGPVTR